MYRFVVYYYLRHTYLPVIGNLMFDSQHSFYPITLF